MPIATNDFVFNLFKILSPFEIHPMQKKGLPTCRQIKIPQSAALRENSGMLK